MLKTLQTIALQKNQLIKDIRTREIKPKFRGIPVIDKEKLTNLEECQNACPLNAITKDGKIDLGKCTFCGECERISNGAISFTREHRYSATKRKDLIVNGEINPIVAKEEIKAMFNEVLEMFDIAIDVFDNIRTENLDVLGEKENIVDGYKKNLNANHVSRLASGVCSSEKSAYFFSTVSGLERIADHLVNVGYSILNPTGSQNA